jgi:hypothetical protein
MTREEIALELMKYVNMPEDPDVEGLTSKEAVNLRAEVVAGTYNALFEGLVIQK